MKKIVVAILASVALLLVIGGIRFTYSFIKNDEPLWIKSSSSGWDFYEARPGESKICYVAVGKGDEIAVVGIEKDISGREFQQRDIIYPQEGYMEESLIEIKTAISNQNKTIYYHQKSDNPVFERNCVELIRKLPEDVKVRFNGAFGIK